MVTDQEGVELEGEVQRLTFASGDTGFGVLRLRTTMGGDVVAIGQLAHLLPGQLVRLRGRWESHATHGRQFRASMAVADVPRTRDGLVKYLGSGAVRGVGPSLAERIVAKFGAETLTVLSEAPERLREVAGIGKRKMEGIRASWSEDVIQREIMAALYGYGVTPAVARRIVDRFGPRSLDVVRRTPYRLAQSIRGIGFLTADRIAREVGVPLDAPERVDAALDYVIEEAGSQGHCGLPQGMLIERVRRLEVDVELASARVEQGVAEGRLATTAMASWQNERPLQRPDTARAEDRVAARLVALARRAHSSHRLNLSDIQAITGLELNADQQRAVQMSLESGVGVVTGGPGTGKTTIVQALLAGLSQQGEKWLLAAPTGRAARRLQEACGRRASTLHRLLEYTMQTRKFARCADNPLECDGVLVDEASMVDLALMDALLEALPKKGRLILVGDAHQLPSVGAGQVLHDVIASGEIPVARLQEIYRQAADSGIVTNAHRVDAGELPVSAERDAGGARDFFLVEREEPEAVRQALLKIVCERLPALGFDPHRDVQVLVPMHRGPLGTRSLNALLQSRLNPENAGDGTLFSEPDAGQGSDEAAPTFRVGDRVIQVQNDYDAEVFNGDVGRVVSRSGAGFVVDFDGKTLERQPGELDGLQLAWAISIHKSQGSEYPAVIIIAHPSHRIMLRRNLLYTAITRAQRFCCVVGSGYAVGLAARSQGGGDRFTLLADRVRRNAEEASM